MPPIQIQSIQFHVDGVTPTFPLRRNASAASLIDTPEWRAGRAADAQGAIAFVQSLQRGGRRALAVVTLQRGGDVSGALALKIQANPLTYGSVRFLGKVAEQEVQFESGQSKTVLQLELEQEAIASIAATDCVLEWTFSVPGEVPQQQSTEHRVYALLLEPFTPWGAEPSRRPWTDVLDVVCSRKWAGGARSLKSLQNRVARRFYKMGQLPARELVYEGVLSYFLSAANGHTYLNCSDFLRELKDGMATSVNCRDAATVVTAFSNILGSKLAVYELTSSSSDDFPLDPAIRTIGGTRPPPSFKLHEIAVLDKEFRSGGADSLVWDGSLRIDVVPGPVSFRVTPSSIGLGNYLQRLTGQPNSLSRKKMERRIAVDEESVSQSSRVVSKAGDASPFLLGEVFDGFSLNGFKQWRSLRTLAGGTVSRWKSRDDKWGWLFVQSTVHKSFYEARYYFGQLRSTVTIAVRDLPDVFQQGFDTDEGRTVAFRRGNVTCRLSSYRSPTHAQVLDIAKSLDKGLLGSQGILIRDPDLSNLSALLPRGGQQNAAIRLVASAGDIILDRGVLSYQGNPGDLRVYQHQGSVV